MRMVWAVAPDVHSRGLTYLGILRLLDAQDEKLPVIRRNDIRYINM